MTLQIDPSIPQVWRATRTLQLGVDRVRATLDELTAGTERIIAELTRGATRAEVNDTARRAGVTAGELARLLETLEPALIERGEKPLRRRVPRFAVDGAGAGAERMAAVLAASGAEVVARIDTNRPPDAAIVVARYAISPARSGFWLRHDVPHLSLVFGDASARVGPLVEPNPGPCLRCVELTRAEADPDWATMATQLVGMPAAGEAVFGASAAVYAATAIFDLVVHGESNLRSTAVVIDASGVTPRAVALHPECGCAALPGSATASAASGARRPTDRTRTSSAAAAA